MLELTWHDGRMNKAELDEKLDVLAEAEDCLRYGDGTGSVMGVVSKMLKNRVINNLRQAYELGVEHGKIGTYPK